MSAPLESVETSTFLAGGGEMGRLMREHNWSGTPLGNPAGWPRSLRSALSTCLNSQAVSAIYWGPDFRLLYNDAYRALLGNRHPSALGRPMSEVWPSPWRELAGPALQVLQTGKGVVADNQRLMMERDGHLVESFWYYSFAPVRGETGQVEGIFLTALDTTGQVLAERKLAMERERLGRMLEQAPSIIAMLEGPEHRVVFANAAYMGLVDRDDVVGRTIAESLPDAVAQGYLDLLDQVYRSGEAYSSVGAKYAVEPTPGGPVDERYVDFVYQPVSDAGGEISGIYVGGADVTERVRAERSREALLRLDDRLRDVARTADLSFAACELLGVALGATRVGYGVLDPDAGTILIERDWSAPGLPSVAGVHRFSDYGAHLEDLRRGMAVTNDDVEADPRTAANPGPLMALSVRAFLDVPVMEDGRTVADLFVHSATPRVWTGEEVAFVRDFAERTRAAIARRQAEASLRASEARYRTLFENIEAGFCVVEVIFDEEGRPVDHRFVETNPAFERQSGLQNAVGRTAREILPEHEQHWFDIYGRLVETGGSIRFEDGSEALGRWFDVHAMRIGEPEQRRVAVLFNDITERRQAEERLRELNADLERKVTERALARSRTWAVSPEIMGVINAEGYFEQSNPAWASVLGWSEEEIARTVFFDFIHPDDLSKTQAAWADATERGLPALRFENRYRHKDGSWRWLSWVAVPDDGKVYCSARDITAEKDQAAALAERTAERDRMWETSPDLMLVIDFDGYFRRVNPAWTHVLGYGSEELVGRHVNEFVLPDDHDETTDAYELAASGGRPIMVNRYRHKDGSTRWISWKAAPAGDLTYATGRDITPEKVREAELAQAQEALRQSQKMEAMGSLTGGVAHDFNNLLTPIIGSLDMLVRKGVGSERERRLIDGALQSAERAKTLVQRLLAFARRQPLQPVAVNVGLLVGGMEGLIGSTLGPTIDIQLDLAPDLPPAKADPNQLEMALLNLAVNARDAMPNGGRLTIAAQRESIGGPHPSDLKLGHYVRLCVTDTGAGMDKATLAKAVEPFFSTKGIGQGTGLGLSMVHGLAAQLGGALTIDSKPGQGTSIAFWLPISSTVVSEDEETATTLSAPVGRGRALLVDDEELVRMSIANMLIDLGFEIVEAGSAEEALGLMNAGPVPDLLVTDHLMPGMTGAELAHEARASNPELPVLVVSGYAEVEGIAPGLPRLTKPFRSAELAASLAALIPSDGE